MSFTETVESKLEMTDTFDITHMNPMGLYIDNENSQVPMLGNSANTRNTKKKVSLPARLADMFKRNKNKNKNTKKNRAVSFQEHRKGTDSGIVVWEKENPMTTNLSGYNGYNGRYNKSKNKKRRDSLGVIPMTPPSRKDSIVFSKPGPSVPRQRSRSTGMDTLDSISLNEWNLKNRPIRISQTSNVIYHSDLEF